MIFPGTNIGMWGTWRLLHGPPAAARAVRALGGGERDRPGSVPAQHMPALADHEGLATVVVVVADGCARSARQHQPAR